MAGKHKTVRNDPSLSAVQLFEDLPPSALHMLEMASEILDVKAGDIFFRPGELGQALFVVEKGLVQTFRSFGAKKLIIADLSPWEVFGEMACVGERLYHCTAQALVPSRVRRISRKQLELFLRKYPPFARRLLDLVGHRYFNVLMDLDATSFRSLIPRLANLLLKRAQADNVRDLTHKEIAERLRVHRESVTESTLPRARGLRHGVLLARRPRRDQTGPLHGEFRLHFSEQSSERIDPRQPLGPHDYLFP
jgi:CRP-like cAMP-binding protein